MNFVKLYRTSYNKELVSFLCKTLKIPRKKITILKGEKISLKILEIDVETSIFDEIIGRKL
ncbi:DUF167 domain-containing protein [bacterium]